MSDYLPFIFLGLVSGSVYALAGVGLILTYKTSGTFNFAHGALGTVAAYLFYTLHIQHGVSWPLAAAISVLVLGPALGFAFEGFGRGLSRTPMVWRIVATIGILVSIEAFFTIVYGPNSREFPHFLPNTTFHVFGAAVTYEQLIIVVISLVATFGLSILFRVTRTGMAMRAVVDDPDLLDVTGTSPVAIRRVAWIIGCVFATLSGLLLAPSVNIDPFVITSLIIQAFGAAAIGGFSSLPLTWIGGLSLGVAGALITKVANFNGSVLGGLPPSLPFIVLFVVLVVAPRSKLMVKDVALLQRPITWRAPAKVQIASVVLVLTTLAFVPRFAGFQVDQWTLGLANVLLYLSIGILVRSAGQVSLCQMTFAAIGAAVFSKLSVDSGLPWLLAMVLAGLIVVPIGALLAIPAIRRSGLYLALATFGFGMLVRSMFYNTDYMFGFSGAGVDIPTPTIAGVSSSTSFYYIVLAIIVFFALLTVTLTQTRFGRLLKGISDSPRALTAQGTSVTITLVSVFCLSAFMAAVSGVLMGGVLGHVGGQDFEPFASLPMVVTVMLAVGREPWYALAALGISLFPVYVPSADTQNYLSLAVGATAVLVALRGQVGSDRMRVILERWFGKPKKQRMPVSARQSADGSSILHAPQVQTESRPTKLVARDIIVRFGGLVAVESFGLELMNGRVTGLIGPNGAGKSTTINVCSGVLRPDHGAIELNGRDISRLGMATRARLGIGRTFQQIELFETMSVRENIALGREGSMAGAAPLSHIVTTSHQRREIEASVADVAETCGLTALLDAQVGSLSTGHRRLVEFARCLAGEFRVLLLDEPASGLDKRETIRFGEVLRRAVADRDLAVLLVEHDMELVMRVCDYVYVMDFGKQIFEGTTTEVRASAIVQAAYLGQRREAELDPRFVGTGPTGAPR